MKIRMTKTVCNEFGSFGKKTVADLPEKMAIPLLEAGAAVPVRDNAPAVNTQPEEDDFVDEDQLPEETAEGSAGEENASKKASPRAKSGK